MNEDQSTLLRLISCGTGTLHNGANGARTILVTERNWRSGRSCLHAEYAQLFVDQTVNDPQRDPDQTPYLADIESDELTTLVDLNAAGRDVRIQVWAGPPETGTLLQSWELASEQMLPAERVPAETFNSTLPPALLHRSYLENQPARPVPYSVTITQALDLVQTPLFELPTTSAISETSAITSTSAVTRTTTTPPFLTSIIAGPPPDAPGSSWDIGNAENVFEQALRDGFAIRFSYTLTAADGSTQPANLYQWPAKTLGAYLRASAVWNSSAPITLQIGGKPIDGWRISERRGPTEWLLFELDGTLIAAQTPSDELLAALAQLRAVRQ
jgi:hypothetical protein